MTDDQYIRAKQIKEQVATIETWKYQLQKGHRSLKNDTIDKEEIQAIYNNFSLAIQTLSEYKEKEFKEL